MPEATDNPVYSITRQGLEKLMSPAAAASILDLVLLQAGVTPETATAGQMQRLLQGPLLNELRQVLPPQALESSLGELARALPEAGEAPRQPGTTEIPPAPAEPAAPPPPARPTVTSGIRTDSLTPGPRSAAELERAVLRLAAFDGVRLVVAVRRDGEAAFHRGSGDVAGLARMGRLTLRLLERSGSISFGLFSFSDSALLLFPWADDALLLAGSRDLNVGAIVEAFKQSVLYGEDK